MTKRNKSLKLGLIGCGQVTQQRHLPALKSLPEAVVVAISDLDANLLNRVADQFHIGKRSADFRELLDDPAIEAIGICVPAQFHVNLALAALDAGKHLFIEKPLALDLDEIDRLVERAAQSSSKIMVGFNLRWHRLVREAREIIQQGILGQVELVRAVLTSWHENAPEWRKRRNLGGGVMIEMAVHHFDLLRFLLRSEVVEVFATSQSRKWDDETATVTARMANGALADFALSERTSSNNEVDIYGQAGRLCVACYHFDGLELFPISGSPGDIRIRMSRMIHALAELPRAIRTLKHGGDYVASYRSQWRHFIDCIRQDASVECTLEDGRHASQIMLAVLESASRAEPVKVAQAQRNISSGSMTGQQVKES